MIFIRFQNEDLSSSANDLIFNMITRKNEPMSILCSEHVKVEEINYI